jgi:hypothetical protein
MLFKFAHIKLLFLMLVLMHCIASCDKEYSYEGGNAVPPVVIIPVDTTAHTDTIPADPGALPHCSFCNSSTGIAEGEWSFKTGNSMLCGVVDTSFMLSLTRNTFTFFGPSHCGADTGLIFTITVGTSLDRDLTNITATSAIFYYYHTNFPYVLLSHNDQPFSFTITSYVYATKLATGIFSGPGFRQDGRVVNVTQGRFKIKLI